MHASGNLGGTQLLSQGTPGELNGEQQEVLVVMNRRSSDRHIIVERIGVLLGIESNAPAGVSLSNDLVLASSC